MSNGYKQGHPKKGVFQPRERPLFTGDKMHEEKRKGIPAPGIYDMPEQKKFRLGFTEKSDKHSYNIDAAVWYSKQTPAVGYK